MSGKGKGGPMEWEPAAPKLRVRMSEDGNWVDLGSPMGELLCGLVTTVGELCEQAGVVEHPSVHRALEAIRTARGDQIKGG